MHVHTGGVESRVTWKLMLDLLEDLYQLLIIQKVTLVTLGGGEYLSRVDSWGELTHYTT